MNALNQLIQKIEPCDNDCPYIFISYSSADRELVWNDVYEFQRRGYNVWLDEKNLDKTKDSWKQDALTAIEDMECMLLVFYVSETSLRSDACYHELLKTIDENTKAMHFGPVKFIAVDVEPVGDITVFTQKVFESIRSSNNADKEERRRQALALDGFMRQFFNSNNEKVRVHPKNEPNRKMDYYEEIIASFPDSARIHPAGTESPRTEADPVQGNCDAATALPFSPVGKAVISAAEPVRSDTARETVSAPMRNDADASSTEENPEVTDKSYATAATVLNQFETASPEKNASVKPTISAAPRIPAPGKDAPIETIASAASEATALEESASSAAATAPGTDNAAPVKDASADELFSLPAEPPENTTVLTARTLYRKDLPSVCSSGVYRIPEGYTDIETLFSGNIFQRAGDVTVLELPDSIRETEMAGFCGCESLREIRLPNYISLLPFESFDGCSSLTTVEVPGAVAKIESRAFRNCTALRKVKLPLYLSELEMCAFENCSSLQEIHLPPSLKKVGINCFIKCASLKEVCIPGSLKKISSSMFTGCTALEKVVLEDGVEEIGTSAFASCGHSLHVWIPDSVQKIAGTAFYLTGAVVHCRENSFAHSFAVKKQLAVVPAE